MRDTIATSLRRRAPNAVTARNSVVAMDQDTQPLGFLPATLDRGVGRDLEPRAPHGVQLRHRASLFPAGCRKAGAAVSYLGLDSAQALGSLSAGISRGGQGERIMGAGGLGHEARVARSWPVIQILGRQHGWRVEW